MKKNVAIPIGELQKSAARKLEIERLNKVVSVPAQDRQSKLQAIDDALDVLVSDSTNRKKALRDKYTKLASDPDNTKTAKELKKAHDLEYGQLLKEQDDLVLPLQRQRAEVIALVTDQEKAEQLASLSAQEAALSEYGLQEMTLEEVAQRTADQLAHDEYVKTVKYKDDRAAAYPSIGDQLDAMWRLLAVVPLPENRAGLEPYFEMQQKIADVKAQFPKPEDE